MVSQLKAGNKMNDCAGIDFGNTYAVLSHIRTHGVDILKNEESVRLIPSIVTYGDNKRYSGATAQTHMLQYVNSTITQLKHLLGLEYDSKEREIIQNNGILKLVKLSDGKTGVTVNYKEEEITIRPEQAIAYLFKQLDRIVKITDPNTEGYVIAISPWWDDPHRRAMLESLEIVDMKAAAFLNSTTAAAIAYSLNHRDQFEEGPQKTVIIDLGDSSLNAAVYTIGRGLVKTESIVSDDKFGGSHFTYALLPSLRDRIKEKYKIDPYETPRSFTRFLLAVDKVKKNLSVNKQVMLEIQSLVGDIDVSIPVYRTEFESAIEDLLPKLEGPILEALKLAGVEIGDVTHVEFLGGGSRVPIVREKVSEIFGKPPTQTLNPDECFAAGAGYYASYLRNHVVDGVEMEISDVYPFVIKTGEAELIQRFAVLPFETTVSIGTRSGDVDLQILSDDIVIGNLTFRCEESEISLKIGLDPKGIFNISSVLSGENELQFEFKRASAIQEDEKNLMKEMEAKMEESDIYAERLEELKNDLEGTLFMIEKAIDRDCAQYFNPESLEEVKKQVLEIREWFEEHTFDSLPIEEYETRITALKGIYDPVYELKEFYHKFPSSLTEVKERVARIRKLVEEEPQRMDEGLRSELDSKLDDLHTQIKEDEECPKYQKPPHQIDTMMSLTKEVETGLKRLRMMPRKPVARQMPQRQLYDFWGNPITDTGEEEEYTDPLSSFLGINPRARQQSAFNYNEELARREEEAQQIRKRREEELQKQAEQRRKQLEKLAEERRRRQEFEQRRMQNPFGDEFIEEPRIRRNSPQQIDPRIQQRQNQERKPDRSFWGPPPSSAGPFGSSWGFF